MKNWFIGLAVLLAGFGAKASEFEIEIDPFKEIEVIGNFKVNLVPGTKNKIEVINNSDYKDERILAEVSGNILEIKLHRDSYAERDIEITVYYTELRRVLTRRGCKLHIDGTLEREHLDFRVESGGAITATVNSEDVEASIQAGGYINLNGKCETAVYTVSAGGAIKAMNLKTTETVATVKAGGRVFCNVSEKLKAEVAAGGSVDYTGDPEKVDKSVSLGGTIRKVNG